MNSERQENLVDMQSELKAWQELIESGEDQFARNDANKSPTSATEEQLDLF